MIAMKKDKERFLVFVGVNDKNEDIIFEDDPSKNILVEVGQKCPPFCNEDSPLTKL
jgi:hypothetical protein